MDAVVAVVAAAAAAGSSEAAPAHLVMSVWSPYFGFDGTEFDHQSAGSELATVI